MRSEVKENRVDFSIIRYSQCWEDTEVLLEALDIKAGDICLGIASAGDNVLSMLTGNPEKVVAIDISFPQVALLRLKIEAFRQLSYEDMLFFLGVDTEKGMESRKKSRKEQDDENRRRIEIFERLSRGLEKDVIAYWKKNAKGIEKGVIHIGKFEKFFQLFHERILPLVHTRRGIDGLLEEKSKEERRMYYNTYWNNFRWKMMFRLFFSNYVVGKLGRDKEFFKYVKEDISKIMIRKAEYAVCELAPRENPYLNYIMKGEYRKECLPYFMRKDNFDFIRRNIDKIEIIESPLEEYLNRIDYTIDKFNLSDIFEYMSQENYERLMDRIYEKSSNGALISYWNLVVPRNSSINGYGKGKFERLKEKDSHLHKKDMTFFYTDFVIEKVVKNGNK